MAWIGQIAAGSRELSHLATPARRWLAAADRSNPTDHRERAMKEGLPEKVFVAMATVVR